MNAYDACPRCGKDKDTRAVECRVCFRSKAMSEADLEFARNAINDASWTDVAKALGRSVAAVRAACARRGIRKSGEAVKRLVRRGRWGEATATERYQRLVIKRDGCWGWRGSKDVAGYGMFGSARKVYRAHRFSYVIHKGEIPKGMYVLHSCDNPECSNPDHLRIGTQLDNMKDMVSRGRHGNQRKTARKRAMALAAVA